MVGNFNAQVEIDSKPFDQQNIVSVPRCYIVSQNSMLAQLVSSVLSSSLTIKTSCHEFLGLQTIINKSSDGQCVYLLDCLEMDLIAIEKCIACTLEMIPNHIMTALYNIDENDNMAPLVKRYRIRGLFYNNDSQSTLIRGMETILDGHLWLRRKMLSDCILMNDAPKPKNLNLLTDREKEILHHVVLGESNQEIADSMKISLHTVKTHLYNSYKKINVPNRLQCALWATTYLLQNPDDGEKN